MPRVSDTDIFGSIIAGLQGAGLTRAQIGRETGLSQATLSRACNGQMRAPAFSTYDRLVRLAEKVGVQKARLPGAEARQHARNRSAGVR